MFYQAKVTLQTIKSFFTSDVCKGTSVKINGLDVEGTSLNRFVNKNFMSTFPFSRNRLYGLTRLYGDIILSPTVE